MGGHLFLPLCAYYLPLRVVVKGEGQIAVFVNLSEDRTRLGLLIQITDIFSAGDPDPDPYPLLII